MRPRSTLRSYQVHDAQYIVDHPTTMLWLDMSLGKTIVTLTAIKDLLDRGQIYGALVLAPRRVAESVWNAEAKGWEHTCHLRVSVLRGKKKTLLARELAQPYEIHVINYESIPWLVQHINNMFLNHGKYPPWNMIVFDEVSRVKKAQGVRISALRPFLPYFSRRVGLTGTPATKGYIDLFGQYLAIDGGLRLGTAQVAYQSRFFITDPYSRRVTPAKGAREQIQALIADITISRKAEDYVDLPDMIYNDVAVELPEKAQKIYEDLEQEMFAELEDTTIEVFNAAALTNKCRQVANGVVLDPSNTFIQHKVHDAKLEALDDIMFEANGQSILLSYVFRADLARIQDRYRNKFKVGYIGPGVGDLEVLEIINRWNAGYYDLLCGHAQSIGHGLNLQYGGHQLVWFGLDWNLENWDQMNARLRRTGQPSPFVITHRILATNTIDFVIRDSLAAKATDQRQLREAIRKYHEDKIRGSRP